MQIIVPMSGFGERFRSAGYKIPKPLIIVENKTIIEHIVDMFPGETNFTFICNSYHLEQDDFRMREILESACPSGKVVPIAGHKLGPVHTVLQGIDHIDLTKPTIVNYSDFTCFWDYQSFKELVVKSDCDGAIPCYRGFHPHLIPKVNLYASCKTDKKGYLVEIKEKHQFNNDKTKDLYSPGLYYFKTGKILKKYCKEMIQAKDKIQGEYYMSLPFNYLVKDKLKVLCPDVVKYFCQWGTPEDLKEYLFWMNYLRKNNKES